MWLHSFAESELYIKCELWILSPVKFTKAFEKKNSTILLNYVELIWFHAAYLCYAQLNFGSRNLKYAHFVYLKLVAQSLVWISHIARHHRPYFADVKVTNDIELLKGASYAAFISLYGMGLISICCYIYLGISVASFTCLLRNSSSCYYKRHRHNTHKILVSDILQCSCSFH